MAHSEDQSNDYIQFHWGKKRGIGGAKKEYHFYESFTFDNVNYSLYDCVYLFKHGEPQPYIGKILKIWEQPGHKRVKILWFFRPNEIQNLLGDHAPLEKEIFLASGEGVGLSNVNALEAIAGKCCVICTSKDKRNRQPSSEELAMADYIFYRTFDVKSYEISETIADIIAGVEVKYLLNWKWDRKPKFEANSSGDRKSEDKLSRKMTLTDDPAKPPDKVSSEKVKLSEKKPKPLDESLKKASPAASEDKDEKANHQIGGVKRRLDQKPKPGAILEAIGGEYQKPKFVASVGYPKPDDKLSKKMRLTNDPQTLEVTRRPDIDKSKWFKGLPWEIKMKNADEQGTLVFIENFDPHYTSSEIEDIFYRAFKQSCEARVIQQATFQDPNYGQAYVIFKTKEAADLAVSKINMGCMMLPDGRPLICSKGMLKIAQPKSSTLTGHYSVMLKPQLQWEEMRKAVSTSHYSQPNTIEYEMAMDWNLLQEKSVRWWDRLFKGHGSEQKQDKKILKLK